MKKIVLLLLFALSLPLSMMAQSNDDDLYFVPSKDNKQEEVKPMVKKEPKVKTGTTTIYTSPGTTVVVEDRKGNKRDMRDVDEYNRRYSSKDNKFDLVDDTLYVKEKAVSDLDGEWVNGFDGSQDDYEYAERIIRFRNPRFAVSISSPLYWDIVYGTNPWDWNVYTDGFYAYAFPTFTNRLWWDWRYNSYGPGWGWGWSPYYAWGGYYPGYYPGYWGGYWGPHWGHHHGYYPGWGGGHWARHNTYTDRRSYGTLRSSGSARPTGSSNIRRTDSYSTRSQGTAVAPSSRNDGRMNYGSRRVVGVRDSERPSSTTRTDASSTRRSTYTRPSSTRTSTYQGVRNNAGSSSGVNRSSSSRRSTYNRGSSTAPSRSNAVPNTRRSTNTNTYSRGNSSSTRSYSPSSSGSSRSYSSGGSSSSRSSGGSYSRSGGGRR